MRENSLFDTGFLYAYLDEDDEFHEKCSIAFEVVASSALLPDIVLPELAYLILRGLGTTTLVKLLRGVADGDFVLERTINEDLERAAEILE